MPVSTLFFTEVNCYNFVFFLVLTFEVLHSNRIEMHDGLAENFWRELATHSGLPFILESVIMEERVSMYSRVPPSSSSKKALFASLWRMSRVLSLFFGKMVATYLWIFRLRVLMSCRKKITVRRQYAMPIMSDTCGCFFKISTRLLDIFPNF